MRAVRIRELLLLFPGDILVLFVSLWLTLLVRYGALPDERLLDLHLLPFSLLFAVWILVYFIAGLYDQHTTIFRARLPERIFKVQLLNIVIAAAFFFLVPIFVIAPKTNLALYLAISFLLMTLWRAAFFPLLLRRRRTEALLIGGGTEFRELYAEVNENGRYPFRFSDAISVDRIEGGALSERVFSALKNPKLGFVVVDMAHRKLINVLPHLYKPIFSDVKFIDARELYEEIFERLPLSALGDRELAEQLASLPEKRFYEVLKRALDVVGALLLAVPTLILMPLLMLLVWIESGKPIFITNLGRIGRGGILFNAYKLRSMERVEGGVWVGETDNRVTKVGAFLRRMRLDELPQLLNILRGELSFVGPRPDLEGLGERLAAEIPFYDLRTRVTPGLSGWAQLKQDYAKGKQSPQSVEESKLRFMYDLYYLKRRSLLLDIVIIVRTIRVVLGRSGS